MEMLILSDPSGSFDGADVGIAGGVLQRSNSSPSIASPTGLWYSPMGHITERRKSERLPLKAARLSAEGDVLGEKPTTFMEGLGGFYIQLVRGTRCMGPDVFAASERLVEIDLSGEFPPERRAAQVDPYLQHPMQSPWAASYPTSRDLVRAAAVMESPRRSFSHVNL